LLVSGVSTPLDSHSRGDIPRKGETRTYARTFTIDDVRAFAGISHDRGVHHVEVDPNGRLIVHGLLTATIPTKLGGELDYLAQEMTFRFHRPVFTGDRVECICTATVVEDRGDRMYIEFDVRCSNQDGKDVLTGGTKGAIIRR